MSEKKMNFVYKAVELGSYIARQQISLHAAHACYFMVLAAFPMLVLLLGILRYSGLAVESLLPLLEAFLPQALLPGARELVHSTYRSTTGAVIGVSLLTTLWSAGRGVYGLMKGLNSIYGVTENRGYFYTRTVSVAYTVAFLLVLQLTLLLQVFGTGLPLETALEDSNFLRFLTSLLNLRFVVLFALQTGLFSAMFMVLPNRKNKFSDSWPGAMLASVGWLIFSDLYSIYVEHFAGYTSIYGSVYAVALSMLWLYFCISILFCGGALNRYLMK